MLGQLMILATTTAILCALLVVALICYYKVIWQVIYAVATLAVYAIGGTGFALLLIPIAVGKTIKVILLALLMLCQYKPSARV